MILHVFGSPAMYAPPPVPTTAWVKLDREVRVRTLPVQGFPPVQISRVAKRLACDLIVLATHGRTGLRHILLGSVAESVVRHAPCPVLSERPARRRK